ncbi:hypothetical protein ABGB12_01335 [Actinocorallia sp. B10E7]|uniref:hypothetical protein n=1 Tax=Actinocorallia sp. B10E7 TaxID=3153558 RepID=UPI00325EB610
MRKRLAFLAVLLLAPLALYWYWSWTSGHPDSRALESTDADISIEEVQARIGLRLPDGAREVRFTGYHGWDGVDSYALAFVAPCDRVGTLLDEADFDVDPAEKEALRRGVRGPFFESVALAFGLTIDDNRKVERVPESSGDRRRRGAVYFPLEGEGCRVLASAERNDS